MATAMTPNAVAPLEPILGMAFETGASEWKIAFSPGLGQRPRLRTVPARDMGRVQWEIRRAKERFGLPADARMVSCYEAGRDGFWLHRALVVLGVENQIVDSSSIEVNRRKRRAKSDRLDAGKLVGMLWRWLLGDARVWGVVRVPTAEEEDRRQLHRELLTTKRDRTRVTNRIKSLLFSQGIGLGNVRELPTRLGSMQIWNGEPVPDRLRERLWREWEKVEQLTEQIDLLNKERRELLKRGEDAGSVCARKLFRLRGLGENASWLFALEFFSWREFKNRREIGGLAGLTPTGYQSGDEQREQGMSKAGSRWIRDIAVEIAWGWLRYQPQSELSLWYARRFAEGSSRLRRIGIVAVSRKLLIELWKYLKTGTPPPGAMLKA